MLVHFNLTFQMIKVQHQPTFLLAHYPAENKMLIDNNKNHHNYQLLCFKIKLTEVLCNTNVTLLSNLSRDIYLQHQIQQWSQNLWNNFRI